jgi:hypothetical protein
MDLRIREDLLILVVVTSLVVVQRMWITLLRLSTMLLMR